MVASVECLDDYRPHRSERAYCGYCASTWQAVLPVAAAQTLECPYCKRMSGHLSPAQPEPPIVKRLREIDRAIMDGDAALAHRLVGVLIGQLLNPPRDGSVT